MTGLRCIFCLEEKPGSVEHIFPLAIGGSITTSRLCRDCNAELGDSVDADLVKHPLILFERWQRGLAGNSGQIPDPIRPLLQNAELNDGSGQRVIPSMIKDGVFDTRLVYHATETRISGGDILRQISIDARDSHKLPDIITRHRKRDGLPALGSEELEAEIAAIMASGSRKIERPAIKGNCLVDIVRFRLGLLKIAYELAFIWFGETYIDTPAASNIRDVLLGRKNLEDAGIGGSVHIGVPKAFLYAQKLAGDHKAFSMAVSGQAMIYVQLFDTFSAAFIMGDAAGLECDHYLAMDVAARRWREGKRHLEFFRIGLAMHKQWLRQSTFLTSGLAGHF